jgi:hypothetical protein
LFAGLSVTLRAVDVRPAAVVAFVLVLVFWLGVLVLVFALA